jgi:hypothetical protein
MSWITIKGDGITNPWLDGDMQPLALTESEIDDLVAFLVSLTSPQYKETGDRKYTLQFARSKVDRPQRDTARAFGPNPVQGRQCWTRPIHPTSYQAFSYSAAAAERANVLAASACEAFSTRLS